MLQLFHEHSRKIATGISLSLVILMSLSVAQAVLFFMETMNPSGDITTSTINARPISEKVSYKISDLELFGKAEDTDASAPVVVDAPETKLNLELQGIFIADDPDASTAIVAEKNKTGELFAIGDRLPGNATLAAVHEDHVLLRRSGRMEKLLFSDNQFRIATPDTSSGPAAAAQTSGMSDRQRKELEKVRNRLRPPGATTSRESGGASAILSRYRDLLQENPAEALSEVGISPVSEGDTQGYRVGAEAQGALQQAGLQAGDVILSVNGRPVGNAANDSALMDQVMASSRVRVEVQRDSRRFFLTVPVPK